MIAWPARAPARFAGGIEAWAVDLRAPAPRPPTADELTRAARFRTPDLARRFLRRRAWRRHLLRLATGRAPSVTEGPHGKPHAPEIAFNASSSGELALLVLADHPIGVDVEQRRPMPDAVAVAQGVFSAAERAELASLPPGARSDAFLTGWVRKEAFVKAIGDGLSHPLQRFDVPLVGAPRLDGAVPAGAWIADLAPAEGWIGALVGLGPRAEPKLGTPAIPPGYDGP